MRSNTVVAVVPMRHNSERVAGKNYKLFFDKPLFHYILQTLSDCPSISKIVVDTDSPIIISQCEEYFSDVCLIKRPIHLSGGEISMNDVLDNTLCKIDSEFVIQTHCTNPLLTNKTIENGIRFYFENNHLYDSLFSVTRRNVRYWNTDYEPINHDPNILLRTQDLPPVFEENSCFYIFSKNSFKIKKNRVGTKPYLFEIEEYEAQDIDTTFSFSLAELMYKNRLVDEGSYHSTPNDK